MSVTQNNTGANGAKPAAGASAQQRAVQPGPGKTVALIPAFNEERYIGSVVIKTCRYVDEVIVVDDGSTDATALIADAAGATVISHPRNLGKGIALQTGLSHARQMGATTLVMLDADGQHLPHEVEAVAAPVLNGEADIVIG